MNKQKLFVVIAAAAGALGTFLPWVTVPLFGSINGTQGDGWITLALFAITIVLAFIGNKEQRMAGGRFYLWLLPSVLASLMGIYKIIDFNSKMSEAGGFGGAISIGTGLYLIIIAGIAALLLGFLIKDDKKPVLENKIPEEPTSL